MKLERSFFQKYTPSVGAAIFLVFMLSACERLFVEANPTSTPTENFNHLWQTINDKYAFLDYKNINWDSVKTKWQPRVSDTMNDVLLFRVLDSMLYTLRDGHVNLYGAFNYSRNWQWYLNYPDNYDAYLLERNYYKGVQRYTGPLVNCFFDSNRIGYMRYGSFSNTISDFDIDVVVSRFRDTKGIIIDVRSNGGGAVNNIDQLVSRFVKSKTLVWREAEKIGTARTDFAAPTEKYIEPKGSLQYTKPIIILTNRRCYSATTFFVAAMLNLPNVKVIGDWTGGGGGAPSSTQLPNGWVLRYSATRTLMPNGYNIENGTAPTIKVDMLKTDSDKGYDTILERAFQELK
ncbi:MAG: S41 family peptidase [Saprospiraceae bacterium]|nr:S41 family peptidase [Saprospiraceae bacterium]